MEWIVEPLKAFASLDVLLADTCSGGGELRHCSCLGGMVVCGDTPNSLVISTEKQE